MTSPIQPGESADLIPSAQQNWLSPLSDEAPCGEDLEYDNAFLELNQAAAGKPETQFSSAEPPNWRQVLGLTENLFDRTRDLRVALLWTRARLNTEGLGAFNEGTALIVTLLENYWDTLHPQPDPDDGDPYARLNALAVLTDTDGFVADLRNVRVVANRNVGELSLRDVEVALGKLPPREDESPMSKGQVSQMLEAASEADSGLATRIDQSLGLVNRLSTLLREQVGIERAPDLRPLSSMLSNVQQLLPAAGSSSAGDGALDAPSEGGLAGEGGGQTITADARPARALPDSIHTRADALKAIELVCDYLERTEPTNPAQLLLRRSRKLINKNFLQLMRELAPDALNEVARIMGVDPDTVESGSE